MSTLSPNVARAAVGLRASHPGVPTLEVLDLVLRDRTDSMADFGDAIEPGTPFGLLLAEAFDRGMAPRDWLLATHPNSSPALVAALRDIWCTDILPRFA
jgi:hypothetical protein